LPGKIVQQKIHTHEKNRTDFQSRLGKGRKKHYKLQQMETFFQLNDLAATKELLNNIMSYALKRNSWIKEDPSVIYHFHQAMRSFVRAGYFIMLKEKKLVFNAQLEDVSPLALGLLSEKNIKILCWSLKKHSKNTASKNLIILFPDGLFLNGHL
jgi:hypothetical protein